MDDDGYIRAAVGLADGWSLEQDVGGCVGEYVNSSDGFWQPLARLLDGVVLKDALAAQLSRQRGGDNDRTMNDIRHYVNSKVLS